MNIGQGIEDSIKRFGEYDSTYFEGRWYTNVEMNESANRLGNALKGLGIERGDRVGVQMPNSPEVLSAFPAIYKIGAVVVPLNPLLAARPGCLHISRLRGQGHPDQLRFRGPCAGSTEADPQPAACHPH
jgi:long-chain acyl-CoA synthetase